MIYISYTIIKKKVKFSIFSFQLTFIIITFLFSFLNIANNIFQLSKKLRIPNYR